MRGRRGDDEEDALAGRLTPAYAGKTAFKRSKRSTMAAHPRVCGEDFKHGGDGTQAEGSPPRMRGRRHRHSAVLPAPGLTPRMRGRPNSAASRRKSNGLTPAYAGKTSSLIASVSNMRAHPRVCGEDRIRRRPGANQMGSPPRMRGRRLHQFVHEASGRLTPAYAGKTEVVVVGGGNPGAHPRVCGEDSCDSSSTGRAPGSPPRMRGRPCSARGEGSAIGLTPAYAGKTLRAARRPSHSTAHPRVCGEDFTVGLKGGGGLGSPPRMRGRRHDDLTRRPQARLTPAYAGKTQPEDDTHVSLRAHPRVCGEDCETRAIST